MDEYIKREDLLELYRIDDPVLNENGHVPLSVIRQNIMDIPAADVAPVRHGRWIDNHCTVCGMMPMGDEMWKNYDCEPPLFERFMDYCPICGAKMDGGED